MEQLKRELALVDEKLNEVKEELQEKTNIFKTGTQ
jgi:hypothetical protein